MRDPPLILAVDDQLENREILSMRLNSQGYEVATAQDGEAALEAIRTLKPDLVLLDIMMPKLDGIAVVRRVKQDASLPFVPVILVTAKAETRDLVAGIDAGGDDYLTKPFDHAELLARVRSMLRLKALHDQVAEQARRLDIQSREIAGWNRMLEQRVADQVDQIARMQRLRRFLPPQVVELIVASGQADDLLKSHRADVTVVFCDLRNFTAFAETADPDTVMAVLGEYHATAGELIHSHDGTLERFVGDGLLVIFNDPVPQADHLDRALTMALRMRVELGRLCENWRRNGHELGFGIGIACGQATLGSVGFEHRRDYSVVGSIPNLAARLCAEAKHGQILISQSVQSSMDKIFQCEIVGDLELKGFLRPIPVFALCG